MTTGDETRIETADVLDADPPGFTKAEAEEIAARHFDLVGRASALASERDQNFLIEDDSGGRAVLKISSAAEQTAVIEMEVAAALHAKRADPELPIALPWPVRGHTRGGSFLAEDYHVSAEGDAGARHRVRMYDFMDGEASADSLSLDQDGLWEFGRVLARLGRALRGFFHPAAGRVLL
ncbi:MAG: phosphotransferase, partial [Acidobacteriota bacterium]